MVSVRPLPKELQQIAIERLHENPETIQDNLNELRNWIKKQKHLNVRTDDQWLLSLLRGCKYNHERVHKKIETLCTVKTNIPEYFENRDPLLPEIQELLSLGLCLPLRKSDDPAAPRVILLRGANIDPSKVLPENRIKYGSMILDILLNEDDNFVIAGTTGILDNKGISISYLNLWNPSEGMKMYSCFRDAYTIRPKGVYIINTPGFIETLYNASKSWLPTFLQNMVHIYSDGTPDDLYKAIPRSVLPEEYGGEGGTLDELIAEWKEKVESYRDWFLEDEKYCLLEVELPEETGSSWLGMGWLMEKLTFE